MAIRRKATFQPYDMDTAIGTNNSGVLMFGYSLEDTDTVSSIISGGDEGGTDAPVFNAQDSVLWNNLRDAFRGEITQMYQQLRTSGAWSAQELIQRAEEHQGKWCEAIYNEDEYFKHLIPLIDPVTVDEHGNLIRTDRYLTMLQGSKEEQRKWWLTNRFRYIDSKYLTGDAVNSVISMRVFNSGTLTIKAAIDLYLAVRFGGGTTPIMQRRDANTSASFTYTAQTGVTEMETWIYSADLITDVGDLSVFYGNEFDFSRATRLQRLKIGDSASNYSNANLKALDVRNSTLLEYIDVRNCPNLAITVNLEGSPRLKEAYFDGTAITGCDLADGASVTKLHLPGTITTLTLINLNKLTEFVCPSFAHVSRLMLSNMDATVVNPVTILNAIPANSQVNIQGLYLELSDATAIDSFLDLLDTMRGVSREKNSSGEWMYHDYDTAQVSGTIHTSSLTGADIADFNSRYPYITVTADHVTSYLTYASYDGTTTYKVVTCIDGVPQDTAPANPTREATAANTYTFVGWSKHQNATTADTDAQTDVIADRTIYAAYTATARTYTVRFYNGSTLLETDTGVPYGGSTTYDGATPVSPDGAEYPFQGWSPAPTNIQGDTSCYARYGGVVEDAEIADSWDEIIASIDDGTYRMKYTLGNYKPLDLGTEGIVNMQIVAFDADELASGGYAPITFVAKELLTSGFKLTSVDWAQSGQIKSYLETSINQLVPNNVKSRIQSVNKYDYVSDTYSAFVRKSTLWIPSTREIFGEAISPRATTGVIYEKIYNDASVRAKSVIGSTEASEWWLRDRTARYVIKTGKNVSSGQNNTYHICLGFCLGLEPETITDSWETILANENPSSTYSIGDTKYLDLGTEGNVLMEIVAFDTDDKADGSGKAKITWISKNLLNTVRKINPADSSGAIGTGGNGGWENCELRTYLKNTIKPLIPETVRNAIVPVTKIQGTVTDGSLIKNGQTTTEDVWIPSCYEAAKNTASESTGVTYYSNVFSTQAERVKALNGKAQPWWTRSAYSTTSWRSIESTGAAKTTIASSPTGCYIALSFCT